MADISKYLEAIMAAIYGEEVRGSIHDAIEAINSECEEGVSATSGSAKLAQSWAVGSTGTRTGENTNNAKYFAEQAANSANNAAAGVTTQLQGYVTQAAGSATTAAQQAQDASDSAQAAANSAQAAAGSAQSAATDVVQQLQGYVSDAEAAAELAQSWTEGDTGKRSGEDSNNAKYWSDLAHTYANSFAGGVTYIGSVAFADLPTSGVNAGWMYNITDAFVTTAAFEEGAGIKVPAGTNVVYNLNGKWDLSSPPGDATHIPVTDTSGISAEAGTVVTTQSLMDAIGEILDTSDYTFRIQTAGGDYIRETQGGVILGTDAFVKLSTMNQIIRDLKQYMATNFVAK